jgi:hypothetical protein
MSSFITTDATQDVFELVLARPVMTPTGQHPKLVHLWWRAPMQGDRLVQVYVNDALYDATLDASVKEMFLVLDRTRQNRIELLAIPADDPQAIWRPQPGLLKAWQPAVSSVASVGLVRDIDLLIDTQLVVEVDGAVAEHGPMWPATETRAVPGDEDAAGLGLGVGELGAGPLGFDGTAWRWRRDDLDAGVHSVHLEAINHTGQAVAESVELTVAVEHLPDPVMDLSITPGFQLAWVMPDTNDE